MKYHLITLWSRAIHCLFLGFFCLFYFNIFIFAQGWEVTADLGFSRELQKASSGYVISIGILKNMKNKSSVAFEVDNSFTSSKGLLREVGSDEIFALRYAENEIVWPVSIGWDRNSFPVTSLSVKPNRYFNCNASVIYYNKIVERQKFFVRAGLGFTLTYRDQMEIFSLLRTTAVYLNFTGEFIDQSAVVPIFAYDTYLDIGGSPRLSFTYKLSERMNIGWNNKIYYFPISNTAIFSSTISFGVNIK